LFSLENKRLGREIEVYSYMMETCTKNEKEMLKAKTTLSKLQRHTSWPEISLGWN